jgi:stage V sporulation protein SpoVS
MDELYIYGNTGAANTQIGTNTLTSLTTGIDNTAFGDTVFPNLTTGDGNSGFGTNVGDNVMGNPSFSTAMGTEALKNITTALAVSGYGYQSLFALTTGKNNTAMGSGAGSTITTALNNTLMGANAATIDTAATQVVAMGANTIAASKSVVIGNGSQSLSTNINAYNVLVGNDIIANAASEESIIIGSRSGVGTTIGSVLVGHDIANLSPGNMIMNSVIMGNCAAENIQDSFEDVIVGHLAAGDVDFSQRNVIIGVEAQRTPVPVTTIGSPLEYIVAIGYQAGMQNSAPGNVFIGSQSGLNTTIQTEIVSVGADALKYVEGSFNTAFGYAALQGVDTVSIGAINNVAVGAEALTAITTGVDNVAMGRGAGQTITTGTNNVFVGHLADGSATLTDSVIVGTGASATADDSVVVGYNASSTASGGIALGYNAAVTTVDSCQVGDPAGLGGAAVLRFRSQVVSDEAWIGGGTSEVVIDNDGNISRGLGSGIGGTSTGTTTLVLETYSVPSGTSRRIEGLIIGRRTDGGGLNDMYSVRIDGAAKDDGTGIIVSTVEEVQVKDDAAWTIIYMVVGATIEVQVTGVAGSTIDWEAEFREFAIP